MVLGLPPPIYVPRRCPCPATSNRHSCTSLCSLHLLSILVFSFLCLRSLRWLQDAELFLKGSPRRKRTSSSRCLGTGISVWLGKRKKWIGDVTLDFNQRHIKTQSGKICLCSRTPHGLPGETIDNILSGRLQAHLASSSCFRCFQVKLGNAESRSKTGKDLIASDRATSFSLPSSSPCGSRWREAIGRGKKPVGWTDILALSRSEKGWQAYGYSQSGQIQILDIRTHEYSNSGLISLFAEAYAASGKTAGLTSRRS